MHAAPLRDPGNLTKGLPWKDIAGKPMTGKPGAQFEYGSYSLGFFH